MKEKKSKEIIPASKLSENSIYFNNEEELIQIKRIDDEKKQLHLFNISKQYHLYFVKFDNHNLIKKVR